MGGIIIRKPKGCIMIQGFAKPDLSLSSVGLGTYLGEMDEATDAALTQAVQKCLLSGVNVIDSAVNYRGERSEQVIGKALGDLISTGRLKREEVFLSTKGGFLAFQSRVLKPADVVAGCHAMTPEYLEESLARSLKNLGVETIDLYYLHNPETQLDEIGEEEFYGRLTKAFQLLERKVSEGRIRMYGTATWHGYRIQREDKGYLSLAKVMEAARSGGGKDHHFKAIQLPYNLAMPEAYTNQNQSWEATPVSAIEWASRAGLLVFSSASLLQGRLARPIPEKVRSLFPGCLTAAACALQFVRSTPAVTSALVGMKSAEHMAENLAVLDIPRLSEENFLNLFAQH